MSRRLGLLVVSVVVGTVVLFAAQLRAVGGSRGWFSGWFSGGWAAERVPLTGETVSKGLTAATSDA